ncbi:MAG: magnesium transporter [Solirubrobacterales bacterium]
MNEDAGSKELLGVAAEHATSRVPTARPGQSVGEVREAMVGERFDSAADVAVLEGDRLVGLAELERVLASDAAEPITGLMDPKPAVVAPGTDQEVAAWHTVHQGGTSLGVADEGGKWVGLIPPNAMLEVLLSAHDSDLARLGGYVAGTSLAREAAEEPIRRRLAHRLPWLVLGLLGAMASAVIVGAFERELDQLVLLAFFLPGVIYMADAVGTQTEAVLIRGLAVEIDIGRMAKRELATGLLMGALLGAAFYPFALLGWGNAEVALGVSLALFASASIATTVAMVLPLIFRRFGVDPAFGSGPLATVIQDLLSIAVYLAIAAPIAT